MAPPTRALSAIASMFGWLTALAYPVVVYVGLTRASPRGIALGLLLLWAVLIPLRRFLTASDQWGAVARPFLPAALPLLGAALLDDRRLLLVVPVVVNLALLVGFASTLRAGSRPLVERFARIEDPELPDGAIAYCRTVTWVWCGFFVLNGAIAAVLALTTLAGWALYTGLLAYVAMAALMVGELLVRKIRFRRYGQSLLDRVLIARFPPHPTSDVGSVP